MSSTSSETTLYADANVPFKEIFHGKLGGHQGLIKYLEYRQSQLSHLISSNSLSEDDTSRAFLGIAAMREAMGLISLLKIKPV
jgi:hypothetical protein